MAGDDAGVGRRGRALQEWGVLYVDDIGQLLDNYMFHFVSAWNRFMYDGSWSECASSSRRS